MYATRLTLSEKYNYLEDKFKAAYKWLAETDICALDDGAYLQLVMDKAYESNRIGGRVKV